MCETYVTLYDRASHGQSNRDNSLTIKVVSPRGLTDEDVDIAGSSIRRGKSADGKVIPMDLKSSGEVFTRTLETLGYECSTDGFDSARVVSKYNHQLW